MTLGVLMKMFFKYGLHLQSLYPLQRTKAHDIYLDEARPVPGVDTFQLDQRVLISLNSQ
jgi:hypothetical protein